VGPQPGEWGPAGGQQPMLFDQGRPVGEWGPGSAALGERAPPGPPNPMPGGFSLPPYGLPPPSPGMHRFCFGHPNPGITARAILTPKPACVQHACAVQWDGRAVARLWDTAGGDAVSFRRAVLAGPLSTSP
jgi:hypothetical protein